MRRPDLHTHQVDTGTETAPEGVTAIPRDLLSTRRPDGIDQRTYFGAEQVVDLDNNARRTRQIKANQDLKKIPIIVVTSYALSGDDLKAFDAGCDAYVAKPFSPRELLAKIREYLP